ncbi:uncharacterized protein LOC111519119 isoform X2 [Drosophila willistoni]|uniref:uncharacterized protein LOC111519119 isoform X2 n=1 Tax=Drosophila willistoni TaxID=7260 RepID=UPI000C26D7EB|nr:uncharacterized protein LOC111519119 isoform X2 [Drosophila willistoni]
MALSGLHQEVGSLTQEEEEANLRTMRTINSFEDVYKTYKHETHCFLPPTIPIDKNKSNTSITTLKNHVDAYRPSTSTLIGQKVRDKIRELRHQHPEAKDRGSLPKNQHDHSHANCSGFRIASGQIINKDNGSGKYCDFYQAEYPDYGVDSCNCESLHQPMRSYPANFMGNYGVDNCNCEPLPQPMSSYPADYMGNYDQCPGQTYFKCCKNETLLTPPNQTKSNHRQRIDFCCCSYGSNESMRKDKPLTEATLPTTQSNMDSKGSESASSEECCCCDRIHQNPSRSENRCYQDRGLIMPDGINKSDCGTHSLCQDRVQCCVGGSLQTKQSNWSDDCSCSPIPSPTTSGCLPPYFLNGCPATNSCCPSTSSSGSCGCPPTSMDCCSCATNCLDIESFLRKFKQVSPTCTPNCLTQPSPPCLGIGSGTAAGMGSLNLNNISPDNNACYCSGGNNFNHFPNSCGGAGCSIRSGCIRMGGAGMPITESCGSNPCYQHPECGGCPPAVANCGLCGDLCGAPSNGIYAVGDLCCGMDFQQCYPLSQLSPGYCCSFPTGFMPYNFNNGCPGPCNMPYSCDCPCDTLDTSCGNSRMYGSCSKATSCHLSQSSNR